MALPNCAIIEERPSMEFAQRFAITDTCILVRDLEASIAFYRDKLGFALKHGAPRDLHAPAGVAIAIKLPDVASLEAAYDELSAKGVVFVNPPADYLWNAR